MTPCVQRLLRVGRNVANLDRAIEFYCDALGFVVQAAADVEWHGPPEMATIRSARQPALGETGDAAPLARCVRLSLGQQEIELAECPNAAPYPAESTSADLWFQHCAMVVNDMNAAFTRLLRHGGGTAISRDGPQSLPASSGGVTAFKFRDPDGHPLELISFPPGAADPVWQQPASGPTIGIDHSAISVADVDRSMAFYERLGFRVASRGVNRGSEQQRLDGLARVEVEVVALQPAGAATPHVELLAYRTPRGRSLNGMASHDIAADRLVLQTSNLAGLLDQLSPDAMPIKPTGLNDNLSVAVIRDPDGHWVVLTQ